ncbi:hypothetical protein [Brachyspira hyodysenteriae]|uniref:hypothetical protein n=1 Tax=Brachyspira hyodysenteriae TaxID=159 RepID=UPI00063DCCFA|nr:hypothetical protein [Brachyspira hyodysenteriae]KLI51991.1 hypothetical protein SZ42_05860 [Brachyspira hyodysenteriae]
MSKKISTIFLTLFLVGVLSVSCSNKDTTGAGETTKGIEQYNGNTYVSTQTFDLSQIFGKDYNNAYMWVSIKDGQVATFPNVNNTTAPDFTGTYFTVTGSGTDYSFSNPDTQGTPDSIVGTLKFSDNSVTLNFTKNTVMPSITEIVCNKK